ncbi:DNA topoisomerase IB [Nocardioides sp.]|uniref:DNA topoisomerase IB n=1 Tax=Nocardioides sp. TaxID=35761 RepID=UPI002734F0C4|nr:DNA topoisomerase IB [Nocardioides sp.]MDP3892129.1 DNA topoisomerase IB [Nocardioides sp.]
MGRLRRVSCQQPGWRRRRAGRGFVYLDERGERLSDADAQRVRELVIPPAWEDVWICPAPNGHLQAVGTDAAGRRQYLYHPDWRVRRDAEKFERMLVLGRRLPRARARLLEDLAVEGMPLERACATAVRLLDLGCFRIGNEAYAEQNGSFGLTTLERRHVRRAGDSLVFCFPGKSGVEHQVEIDEDRVIEAIDAMRRRRGAGDEAVLAFQDGRRWVRLPGAAVNDYLRDLTGLEVSAKDFRTWHATVLAAAALADTAERGRTESSRRRAISAAMKEVADFLGNTPAVARGSYVDPRVVDSYLSGSTIELRRRFSDRDRHQAAVERAVVRLLDGS